MTRCSAVVARASPRTFQSCPTCSTKLFILLNYVNKIINFFFPLIIWTIAYSDCISYKLVSLLFPILRQSIN